MKIKKNEELIPEKNIVIFSPHFDDVLFMLGGYISELSKSNLLGTKKIHINIIFSVSNYQAGSGVKNNDRSLERIKFATGNRIIEDKNCLDELIGQFNYSYQLLGEDECIYRGKTFADSEMEFPHGMYDDFTNEDKQIFSRLKNQICKWAIKENTALIFPLAIKEHIDHFITREAAIEVVKESNNRVKAKFYFQEDKPYSGLATEEELNRINNFIDENKLTSLFYKYNPNVTIDLAFKHYVSQVEEVYKEGIINRANFWKEKFKSEFHIDRICVLDNKNIT